MRRTIFWKHNKTTIKPTSELTKEQIDQIRLSIKRAALHRAVDSGLFDDRCKDI